MQAVNESATVPPVNQDPRPLYQPPQPVLELEDTVKTFIETVVRVRPRRGASTA